MNNEVDTIILKDKEFIIVDKLEHNGEIYMYLVCLDGSEFQVVKKIEEELNIIVKTVTDKTELEEVARMFAERFMKE